MHIYPAIDIVDGAPVRLLKGDYATAHRVADSVSAAAADFRQYSDRLHVVDLDGALKGTTDNFDIITRTALEFDGFVEVGGGIRDMKTVEAYLDAGISRVIIGTAAVKQPDFLHEVAQKYGKNVAVGIDSKDGYVAIKGWTEQSQLKYIDFAKHCEQLGIGTLICTDIYKDGMLSGPNLEQLGLLRAAVGCEVIASGGVHILGDIKDLIALKVDGAICGKSLYEGTLSLKEAVALCEGKGE